MSGKMPPELAAMVMSLLSPYKLPPELIAMVVSHLSPYPLTQYVTISRQCQYEIERGTFRKILLKSTDLQSFSDIFIGHRRAALRELTYDAILPTYSGRQRSRRERTKDQQLNSEALTEAVHGLFSVLHSWNGAGNHGTAVDERGPSITFRLQAYSLMDLDKRNTVNFLEQASDVDNIILRVNELPEVTQISDFRTEVLCWARRIEGSSLAGIAAKLPNLERISWVVNDDEKRYPALRQQHRFDFAQSLQDLRLQFLRKFDLEIPNRRPLNEHFNLQSALLPSSPSIDHLGLALHALSQLPSLIELTLARNAVISPCLFWPEVSLSANPPFWPNLRCLQVYLNSTTPDGNWLFPGDLNTEETNPMLLAMARAAAHMPRLQWMELNTGNDFYRLEVTYLAPGQDINSGWKEDGLMKGAAGQETGSMWLGGDLAKKRWHILISTHTIWDVPDELERAWKSKGSPDDEVVIMIDEGSYRRTKF